MSDPAHFEVGDIVTRLSGRTGFMRVKAISNPTTVIVEDPMGQCKKTEWEEQISDLRNVTKGDNL